MAHYKGFIDFLVKYEELNVKKAKENMPFTANILVGDNKVDLKDKLNSTAQDIKNPFKHVKTWV